MGPRVPISSPRLPRPRRERAWSLWPRWRRPGWFGKGLSHAKPVLRACRGRRRGAKAGSKEEKGMSHPKPVLSACKAVEGTRSHEVPPQPRLCRACRSTVRPCMAKEKSGPSTSSGRTEVGDLCAFVSLCDSLSASGPARHAIPRTTIIASLREMIFPSSHQLRGDSPGGMDADRGWLRRQRPVTPDLIRGRRRARSCARDARE